MTKRVIRIVAVAALAALLALVLGGCFLLPSGNGGSGSGSGGSGGGSSSGLTGTYYLEYVEDSNGNVIATGSQLNDYYPRDTNFYRFVDDHTLQYGFDDNSGSPVVNECSYSISGSELTFTNLSSGKPRYDQIRTNEIVEPGNDGNYIYVLDK